MRRPSLDPLIVVLAPEPAAWLDRVVNLDDADLRVIRLWPPIRRAGTAWARGRADRRIQARFVLRSQLDRHAARAIDANVVAVYAPSLCARRTFAAAKRLSPAVECHLVEDIADLRQLHEDLDRAAAAHPEARFLRRHRASAQQVARQEAERVLADVIHVRSHFAEALRVRSGLPATVRTIDASPVIARRRTLDLDQPTMLLAGLATARAGTYEALGALDSLKSARLLVRAGEGLEPSDLIAHPRVKTVDRAGPELDGVDIVLAPSWCEAQLPELTTAAELGVPIVATTRAAGVIDMSKAGATVEPGDVEGLTRAIREIVAHSAAAQNTRPESRQ